MYRLATTADVPALSELEERSFQSDRLSARSFRRLLSVGNAALVLDEEAGQIRAYGLVLFRRGTVLARLYSFAVDPKLRGRGLGRRLLEECERIACERGAIYMRLEVRSDNEAAIAMYRDMGYRKFSVAEDYYEDHMDAQRMEKLLVPHLDRARSPVPYYAQTLEFTCGPSCLMMAFRALDPGFEIGRTEETRLWREATTIFMTAGIGGCGALGLALAAHRRGFHVEVAISDETEMFIDSVRSAEKKEVIRLVEEDFTSQAVAAGIPVSRNPLKAADLRTAFEGGAIPIVLISAWRLMGDLQPHWIIISGFDERFAYIHDPYVDTDEDQTETDCIGLPVPLADLDRMMRLGRKKHFASLLVSADRGNGRK